MRLRTILAALLLVAPPAHASLADPWRAVPGAVAPDSLPAMLAALEVRGGRGVAGGEAAFVLGQFHYARGEYRQAADAFLRSGAHLGGEDRNETRYWTGLALLALGDGPAARGAFEDASHLASRRALARLGIAQAFELEHHPDRAYEVLRDLLDGNAGEAAPAALERLAALATATHHEDAARRARQRLSQDYPASVEAARLIATPPVAASATGPVAIQVGVFADRARAVALADAARKAGFTAVQVIERAATEGKPALFVVRLGTFGTREEARAAGEKAERALGVGWQVLTP